MAGNVDGYTRDEGLNKRWLVALGIVLTVLGCRDGQSQEQGNVNPPGGGPMNSIVPSTSGTNGCNGADQPFLFCNELNLTAPLVTPLTPQVSELTRIAAAQSGTDLLYATGMLSTTSGSAVLEIDLSNPANPAVRHLVTPASIDLFVSGLLGVPGTTADLAGIAVLDADTVLVVELKSNTVLAIGRTAPGFILHYAGSPSAVPQFADGDAKATAGFGFDAESELCPTDDGIVFVADTVNNAIRVIVAASPLDPNSLVLTATGIGPGAAGFADGDLITARFDAPTGVSAHCADRLIVTERGDGGAGHRLRSIRFSGFDPAAGSFVGTVITEVGDGTPDSTAAVAPLARTAKPQAPRVAASGEIYWIDSMTGVMRRESTAGFVDCPLAPAGDCSTPSTLCSAGAGSDFAPGASFSMAISGDGDLYVLESGTTLLRRFGP